MKTQKRLKAILAELNDLAGHLEDNGFGQLQSKLDEAADCIEWVTDSLDSLNDSPAKIAA